MIRVRHGVGVSLRTEALIKGAVLRKAVLPRDCGTPLFGMANASHRPTTRAAGICARNAANTAAMPPTSGPGPLG